MKLTIVAASFQEYFLASGCEGQAHSAIGLIGPRFAGGVVPAAMTGSYTDDCEFSNVEGEIDGVGEGAPYTLLEAGGETIRVNDADVPLW